MWLYKDKEFTSDDINDYIGFVYIITNLDNGMKYIGKKIFHNKVTKPPLKGKKRRRISKKESDWKEYYGSGPDIKEAVKEYGKDNFKREILYLCVSKAHMGYLETKEIFAKDAIIREDYYNSWVSARINKGQLGNLHE